MSWLRKLLCRHSKTTNRLTVSGYGYTEYEVWFCCYCHKGFVQQTKEQP